MTQEQIKVFKELVNDVNFKGRDALDYLLWRNTTQAQFKKGQCFIVSDSSRKILSKPARNFKAKIIKVYSHRNIKEWRYDLEAEVTRGDRSIISTFHYTETELQTAQECKDNINILS